MTNPNISIELEGVTKVFGRATTRVTAVQSISFALPHGDFWAITGPSGSGKSTVLHLVAGLTTPDSGRVFIEGTDVSSLDEATASALRRQRVGYVLQNFSLLPFLSASENVEMPLILDGVAEADVKARAAAALELVHMHERAAHRPSEMSGGEQQRVAIARALVIDPAIVLADEPTGNLDRAGGTAVMDVIQDINEQTRVTVLMVTHDPAFAACSNRVLRMVDGKIDQEIDLSESLEPGVG